MEAQHSRTQANQISGEYKGQLLDKSTDGPTRGDAQLDLLFPKMEELVGHVVMWVLLTAVTMK